MDIHPVLRLEERLERARHFSAVHGSSEPYSLCQFLAHVTGLEEAAGKRVLEIGGTDRQNMAAYFLGMGAMYQCVRLEENPLGHPWVLPNRDFRDLPTTEPYDLVISCGVFEIAAINRSQDGNDFRSIYDSNERDLRKLFALTKAGGFNIIGTVSDPCMFSTVEMNAAGFAVCHRGSPFYSLLVPDGYMAIDESELVILQRHAP